MEKRQFTRAARCAACCALSVVLAASLGGCAAASAASSSDAASVSDVAVASAVNGTAAADDLEAALAEYHKIDDVTEAACFIRDEVLPKMDALRAPADEAERFTAAEYWPFPTYGDLLFGVK